MTARPRLQRLRWVLGLALAGVLVAGAGWALRASAVARLGAGRPLPDVTLPDLQGRRVALSGFLGKPLILRFSSVNCTLCSDDWGQLAARQAAGHGAYRIVAVEVGDSLSVVRGALAGRRLGVPVLVDAGARLADALGLQGLPTYAFVNARGDLVSLVYAGNRDTELSAADWSYYLARTLGHAGGAG